METVTLERTGDVPLTFEGEVVSEGDTSFIRGQRQNRWYELTLYRTKGGKWVLATVYRSQWQQEHDARAAQVYATAQEVVDELRADDGKGLSIWDLAVTELADDVPDLAEKID